MKRERTERRKFIVLCKWRVEEVRFKCLVLPRKSSGSWATVSLGPPSAGNL